MARVTVEDCLKNVKNRFELVIVAAKRARQLMHGKEARVEWDNDKPTVVALREIAAGFTAEINQPEVQETDTLMVTTTTATPDGTVTSVTVTEEVIINPASEAGENK